VPRWTSADIPDLTGQTVIVTGASSGIGLETAAGIAAAGGRAVLACRNLEKAAAAQSEILGRGGRGPVEVVRLDLGDQGQIAEAAAEIRERFPRIDRLINNAGVMALPFSRTVDGFETVWATNHLGHFALTARVLPALLAAPAARVVTITSTSHRTGTIRWDDLDGASSYRASRAYAQSKLANLMFALGLQRRLEAAGADAISLAAHPGVAITGIAGPILERHPRLSRPLLKIGQVVFPSAAVGARPTLRAATAPDVRGGELYGPGGILHLRGAPVAGRASRRALDEAAIDRLWDVSVDLTGVDPGLS
jgi:NAD(P)-dependent dehydrogenase (short-subunit alcohol dehydrogenase family)